MAKEKENYEEEILQFLKSYKIKHGTNKTMELMQDIIQKKSINHLPKGLKEISTKRLSEELSRIVINQIKSDIPDKYDMTPLLPSILRNHMTVSKKKDSSLSHVNFVKKSIAGATLVAAVVVGLSMLEPMVAQGNEPFEISTEDQSTTLKNLDINTSNLSNDSHYTLKKEIQEITQVESFGPTMKPEEKQTPIPTEEPTKVPNMDATSNFKNQDKMKTKEEKVFELNTMLDKEEKKEKILNNFSKCKTIESIFKRQKELESLGLTKEDKLYKNCKLSAPLQRFIYEQSVAWGVTSTDFSFALIDTETRGDFNSSRSSTYNKTSDTTDLGLTQQNDKWRVKPFAQAYKIDYDEAKDLVQNNDYVNFVCACLEYQEIASQFDQFTPDEYAGYFNAWKDWKQIAGSRYYVKWFKNVYQNKYTKYHKVETIKKTEKGKNKVNVKRK